MDRPAAGHALRNWAFAVTTAHTKPICDIILLGLASQPARFIGPGGAWGPVERRELVVLLAAHSKKKEHYIGLLLPP